MATIYVVLDRLNELIWHVDFIVCSFGQVDIYEVPDFNTMVTPVHVSSIII